MARKVTTLAVTSPINTNAQMVLSKEQVDQFLTAQNQAHTETKMVEVTIAKARRTLEAIIKAQATKYEAQSRVRTQFLETTNTTFQKQALDITESWLLREKQALENPFCLGEYVTVTRTTHADPAVERSWNAAKIDIYSTYSLRVKLQVEELPTCPKDVAVCEFNVSRTTTWEVPKELLAKATATLAAIDAKMNQMANIITTRKTQLSSLFQQESDIKLQLSEKQLMNSGTDVSEAFTSLCDDLFARLNIA